MRIVVQRVNTASVAVNERIVGKIDFGLVLLVGFTHGDSVEEIDYMIDKVINLRIFEDENNIMNKSLLDINGSILSISQFTLYANTKNGRRPSYVDAMNAQEANKLYELFNQKLKEKNVNVETGVFGADMQVSLVNDGPVTIILERGGENGK